MKRLIGTLLVLTVTTAGALAQEAPAQNKGGEVVLGKEQGVKLAQDQCQALWLKANPAKKPKISAGQAQPFISDVKAANPDGDGTIEQNEFMAACDKGLIKSSAVSGSSSTGSSSGAEGSAAPPKSSD
jgi:hypothetical protein